ncbi:MAG: hypothetical protein CL840_15965 [Crocinitomicaceae bacterium]|nr:hypothetical protein [Crocinitomicaceae bacterium]|tara:strand:- start:292 stop:585 length:294 start_codon:yes stop_codon:yes gene_type:complete
MSILTGSALVQAIQDQNKESEAVEALDNMVHECKSADASNTCDICPDENPAGHDEYHDQFSMQATNINNQGLDAQLAYLGESGCTADAEALLRDLLA